MSQRHWPALLILAGLLTGCASLPGVQHNTPAQTATAAASAPSVAESLTFVGPPAPPAAPVPAATPAQKQPDMQKLQKTLNQYLAAQDGTYGVFVIDLTTGQSLGINSDTVFPAASTFKLPMSLYILNLASQGKVDLNEQLAYQESDYEDGTGILQDSISVGDTYPIKELIKLAITQSDNIATHMLLDRFGIQNVYDYMHQLGGQVTEYDDETIGTTPKEMARYMRSARGTKAVTDPALRQFLIDCLENTAFVDRTAAGVPEGVAVAHKIGTLPNVVNDVALVLAPDHPFIISAFSKDVNDDQAPQVITDVTRQVYDFLTNS